MYLLCVYSAFFPLKALLDVSDFVFWCGDLNYRCDASRAEAEQLALAHRALAADAAFAAAMPGGGAAAAADADALAEESLAPLRELQARRACC
jgi:hypothetical protein